MGRGVGSCGNESMNFRHPESFECAALRHPTIHRGEVQPVVSDRLRYLQFAFLFRSGSRSLGGGVWDVVPGTRCFSMNSDCSTYGYSRLQGLSTLAAADRKWSPGVVLGVSNILS